jgi:hypothetical protein
MEDFFFEIWKLFDSKITIIIVIDIIYSNINNS